MKINKKWFSLIIAMWLVLISSLFAYTILEYMIPFSKNIKWIENSSKSYYQANNWIEMGLYFFWSRSDSDIWNSDLTKTNFNWTTDVEDFKYSTLTSTSVWINTVMPFIDQWNSEFDDDFNIIKVWEPIQLSVWYWFISNIDDVDIEFKVPAIEWVAYELNWSTTWIINWQLSSNTNTLNSQTSSLITEADINGASWLTIWLLSWKTLTWGLTDFRTFFNANCTLITSKCILKFSIINDITTRPNIPVAWLPSINLPYLEWRLDTWNTSNDIPLRYSIIESTWKSSWFSRQLKVRHPQETVSEAFDFTVFQ